MTIKSDDVVGRVKAYEAILKGKEIPNPGIPESFRVLQKELKSLAIDVNLLDDQGNIMETKDIMKEAQSRDKYPNFENLAEDLEASGLNITSNLDDGGEF